MLRTGLKERSWLGKMAMISHSNSQSVKIKALRKIIIISPFELPPIGRIVVPSGTFWWPMGRRRQFMYLAKLRNSRSGNAKKMNSIWSKPVCVKICIQYGRAKPIDMLAQCINLESTIVPRTWNWTREWNSSNRMWMCSVVSASHRWS